MPIPEAFLVLPGAQPLPLSNNLPGIQPRIHRSLEFALFGASISWVVAANVIAARAAQGLTVRLRWSDEFLLLDAVFLVFLLALGFGALQRISLRVTSTRESMGLPPRASSAREWATGAAIGWGLVVAAVLPAALGGALHVRFWVEGRSFWLAGLNLATVALLALASETAFRGYPYQRLIDAIGTGWATVVMALIFGVALAWGQESTYLSTVIAILFGGLLSAAWLRTHALWLGWGLHFAWIVSLGVLFGLPVAGIDNLSSVVQTRAIGPRSLTGGDLGVEGALWTLLVLAAGVSVLVRVSRDWAWEYTRRPLIPAGFPMDVPPPAEHLEMEKVANAPMLVQISPTTPQTRSVEPQG